METILLLSGLMTLVGLLMVAFYVVKLEEKNNYLKKEIERLVREKFAR